MAGLNSAFRPSASSSSAAQGFASKLLLLLAALPLTLAALAFVLQWRGGLDDPASRWPAENEPFPGMGVPVGSSFNPVSSLSQHSSSSSDCADILGQGSSPSLSYYNGWKFDANSDLRPRVGFDLAPF